MQNNLEIYMGVKPGDLLGMEGRGAYAGSTIAGLHAEVSHRDGASWGFEERVYYGSTDEGNKLAADGKHREVSRMLCPLPQVKMSAFNS